MSSEDSEKEEIEAESQGDTELGDLPESISEMGEEPPPEALPEEDEESDGYSKLEEQSPAEAPGAVETKKEPVKEARPSATARAGSIIKTALKAGAKAKSRAQSAAKAVPKRVGASGSQEAGRSKTGMVSLALAGLLGATLVGGMAALWQMFGSSEVELPQGALFLAQFHPIFVHVPITLLVVVFLMELMSMVPIWRNLGQNTLFLLWLAALGSGAAIVAGYLLKASGEYQGARVETHMWLGLMVAVGAWAVLTLKSAGAADSAYRVILALTVVVLILTGHLGGTITHGPDYLVKEMPEPYRSWPIFDDGRLLSLFGGVSGESPDGASGRLYDDYVAPLLEEKCTQCHGEDKQKGKLRLDSHEFILKGAEGSDFSTVVAGDVEQSELLARVHLPIGDDDHMPPEGEPQLTAEEVELLEWWIGKGKASAFLVAADIALDMKLAAILKKLGPPKITEEKAQEDERKGGEPAPVKVSASERETALKKIRAKGFALRRVSAEDEGLQFNAVNVADEFDDAALALFEPIAENIVELRLGKTRITDKSAALLGRMHSLVTLHLEQTGITDAAVAKMGELDNLEYLNLYDTKVTDEIIEHLLKLDRLKTVYLWQTGVSAEGAERLRASRPGLKVDMGWAEKKTAE